ncbi:MAG TPA: FCD domain-containing protein [Acidobacteriaceae bacterium]|jgi:GntR family transcriptional repressor for pyruvate dehydrogenase complex|nr:FCD domain-containing protein [Acidobacteriaceae bacterium]
MPKSDTHRTMRVVNHIRNLIETGGLQAGDKIPPEREFARRLRVSRASLRTGIGYLAAMGVMDVRHGVGTFVAQGPPEIGKSSLGLLGALHGFQSWQMFEARRILESELAALAAERGRPQQLAAMSDEVAEMYSTVENPIEYLIHDVRFHRVIAQASGNPILAALMETITSALYDDRRKTAERSRDLRQSADMHHEIYRAIRAKNAPAARAAMQRHLTLAQSAQDQEIAEGATNGHVPKVEHRKPAEEQVKSN